MGAAATKRPMIQWKFSQRVGIQRMFPKSPKHMLRTSPDKDSTLLVFEVSFPVQEMLFLKLKNKQLL